MPASRHPCTFQDDQCAPVHRRDAGPGRLLGGSDPKTTPDADKGTAEKIVEISPLNGTPMPNGRPDNPVFVVKIENTFGGAAADRTRQGRPGGRRARRGRTHPPRRVLLQRAAVQGRARPVDAYDRHRPCGPGRRTDHRLRRRQQDLQRGQEGRHHDLLRGPRRPWLQQRPEQVAPLQPSDQPQDGGQQGQADSHRRALLHLDAGRCPKKTEPAPTDSATPPPAPKTATGATVRFSPGTRTEWALKGGKWVRTNGHAPAATTSRPTR